MQHFILDLVKLWRGNAWNKAGLFLIMTGGAILAGGWLDVFVALLRAAGVPVEATNAPEWTGGSLILAGILLLVANRLLPEKVVWGREPNSHDIELLRAFRSKVTPSHTSFLRAHDFANPVHKDQVDPFSEIYAVWRGPNYEFQDRKLRKAFAQMAELNAKFARHTIHLAFLPNSNVMKSRLTDQDRYRGIAQTTRDAIHELNSTAKTLASAIDDFERLARKRLPKA